MHGVDRAHRLPRPLARHLHVEVGAHPPQHLDETDAAGVQAHVLDHQVRPGGDAGGHHEEGGRRRVAGDVEIEGRQGAGLDPGTAGDGRQPGPEGGQEPFGVVTAGGRLGDLGGAGGLQAGDEQGRLHLGAGHRQIESGAGQVAAPDRQRDEHPALPAVDAGAHGPQRLDHPGHGTAGQGRVAVEDAVERPAGQQPGQEAGRRPRVAAVDDGFGLAQAVESRAPHAGHAVGGGADLHAQGGDGGAGAADVVAVGQAADAGCPVGHGREQQGPVRDRLVTRQPQPPDQGAGAGQGDLGDRPGGGCHHSILLVTR